MRCQAPRGKPARVRHQVGALGGREVEVDERIEGREGRPAHEDEVVGGVDAPLAVFSNEGEGTGHGSYFDPRENPRGVDARHPQDGHGHVNRGVGLRSHADSRGGIRVVDEDLCVGLPRTRRGGGEKEPGRGVIVLGAGCARQEKITDEGLGIGAVSRSFCGELDASTIAGGHIEGRGG